MATQVHRPSLLIDPEHAVLRASRGYDLVPLDRLPVGQRRLFTGPRADPDLHGVLRAKRPGAGVRQRLVDHDTARLFRALHSPGQLRAVASERPGRRDLTHLILDGVLELETEAGFVSGPSSLRWLLTPIPIVAQNSLAQRSLAALRYGQRLGRLRPAALSARLYRYGRLPLTASWGRRLRGEAARVEALGLTAGDATQRLLARHWQRRRDDGGVTACWGVWFPRAAGAAGVGEMSFKLYVSPRPEALGEALRITVEVLASTQPWPLKVAVDPGGFLRPDKLIVYLSSRQALDGLATALLPELAHLPAHGVPFTAAADPHGLLSWAPEPPEGEQTLPWLQRESWRLWLTNRMALALNASWLAPAGDLEGWRYAAERLRLEGIDPETFCPEDGLWQAV